MARELSGNGTEDYRTREVVPTPLAFFFLLILITVLLDLDLSNPQFGHPSILPSMLGVSYLGLNILV